MVEWQWEGGEPDCLGGMVGCRAVYKEGELEKQSSENPRLWKKRWFVMQENKLFYYKSQRDVIDNKPSDKTCCAVISLEDIDSVTTAVRAIRD